MNNMMKFIIILLTGLLLFWACDNFMGPKEIQDKTDNTEVSGGKVTLRLSVKTDTARTILPAVDIADITRYVLTGDSGTGEEELADFNNETLSDTVITVEQGTWDFVLEAYIDDALILRGSINEIQVTSSGGTLDFTLWPLYEGKGGIHITLNFPEGSGISSVAVMRGGESEPLTINENSAVYEETDVDAGDYFFSFLLYDSLGNRLAVYSVMASVRSNLACVAVVDVTMEDLNFAAMTLVNLAVTSKTTTSITLEWDALLGADEYIVRRSTTISGTYTDIGTSETTSFTDANLPSGTTYYYRVLGKKESEIGRAHV